MSNARKAASIAFTGVAATGAVTAATLHISNVNGCLGQVSNGNTATFSGNLSIKNGTGGHPIIHHNTS